jgi:flagellar basal body-associated protein FliL
MTKTEKQRIKFSKRLLIVMLIFLIVFTAMCLFINYKTGYEPSTLITAVFSFCSIEGGIMGFIKVFEPKESEEKKNEINQG